MKKLVMDHVSATVNGNTVLRDVELQCESGMTVCLGAGGQGKTTLCRVACGLVKPSSGAVHREGRIAQASRHSAVPKELTMRQAVQMQKRLHGNVGSILHVAEGLEMTQLLGAHWHQLTEYQKAAASLLLAFATDPDWLVCDDLAYGLADAERGRLLRALKSIADERNTAILWISGDERDAEGVSEVYRLVDGCAEKVKI